MVNKLNWSNIASLVLIFVGAVIFIDFMKPFIGDILKEITQTNNIIKIFGLVCVVLIFIYLNDTDPKKWNLFQITEGFQVDGFCVGAVSGTGNPYDGLPPREQDELLYAEEEKRRVR